MPSSPRISRIIGNIFYVCLVFVLALAAGEVVLRMIPKDDSAVGAYVSDRLRPQWTRVEPKDSFTLPLTVFADRNPRDPERLKTVYLGSRYAPNAAWDGPDFLQREDRARATGFHIRLNSMGHRDIERSCEKPPHTWRVLALGDYLPFGQGVPAEAAYPAVLEGLLKGRRPGVHFEVWNAGRQAGTAIEGLATLRYELWACKPDEIILSYGFVDRIVVDDDYMPAVFHVPATDRLTRLWRRALRAVSPLVARSLLTKRAMSMLLQPQIAKNIARWKETMSVLLEEAKDRKVRVEFMDHQINDIPSWVFVSLMAAHPEARYVSLQSLYAKHAPSARQRQEFLSRPHWTEELDFKLSPSYYASYSVDVFHPNQWGHEAIAEGLADEVLRDYDESAAQIRANRSQTGR